MGIGQSCIPGAAITQTITNMLTPRNPRSSVPAMGLERFRIL